MRKFFCLLFITIIGLGAFTQTTYDSITISRFLINEKLLGKNWKDTLKAGRYTNYITGEKTMYRRPTQTPPRAMGVMHPVLAITENVKKNGTEDVSKCFIPRHSINYYKGGKIIRFMQVCFECDGLHFSDDPQKVFVKSVATREKQMAELKQLFKPLDQQPEERSVVMNEVRYDSITIGKIKGGWNMMEPGNNVIIGETSVWTSSHGHAKNMPDIIALTDSIRSNGTGPIGRCFFPRHRINYYKDGKLDLYLLVCFECSELQFSDDKFQEMFVKDRSTRMEQIAGLRVLFKDLLNDKN